MLDQPITLAEVSHSVEAIINNKSAGSGGIVGELIKYGGKAYVRNIVDHI